MKIVLIDRDLTYSYNLKRKLQQLDSSLEITLDLPDDPCPNDYDLLLIGRSSKIPAPLTPLPKIFLPDHLLPPAQQLVESNPFYLSETLRYTPPQQLLEKITSLRKNTDRIQGNKSTLHLLYLFDPLPLEQAPWSNEENREEERWILPLLPAYLDPFSCAKTEQVIKESCGDGTRGRSKEEPLSTGGLFAYGEAKLGQHELPLQSLFFYDEVQALYRIDPLAQTRDLFDAFQNWASGLTLDFYFHLRHRQRPTQGWIVVGGYPPFHFQKIAELAEAIWVYTDSPLKPTQGKALQEVWSNQSVKCITRRGECP